MLNLGAGGVVAKAANRFFYGPRRVVPKSMRVGCGLGFATRSFSNDKIRFVVGRLVQI